MKSSSSNVWLIVIIIFVLLCLCTVCTLGALGVVVMRVGQNISTQMETPGAFNIPTIPGIDTPATPAVKTPAAPITPGNASDGAFQTLKNLTEAIVPLNDPIDLAERIGGVQNVPTLVPDTTAYKVGDRKDFWISNTDTNDTFKVTAVLRKIVPSAYFWIEEGASFKQAELDSLADTFDKDIYPTNREFFGSEWQPGIDGDNHLYIVYAHGMGNTTAAYFSSVDELPVEAHKYSNQHETFMVNADTVGLGEEYTYGVLAHEFQHMIHWHNDRNEDSWVNEGFSELAAFLNSYDPGGFDYLFAQDPDMQLTDWPQDSDSRSAHYGSSFLFFSYFLDRFGEDATKALVADEANGMVGVENALKGQEGIQAPDGKLADQFFAEWTVANYLNNASVHNGVYSYRSYKMVPSFTDTETYTDCTDLKSSGDVSQYGTDYIAFECGGPFTINFQGANEVGVLSQGANSGNFAFWSNSSDESNMTLTQEFDFTGVNAPIDIEYSTWYNLEEDYDYLYFVASTDGKVWEILSTPDCTTNDPSGNSYGCAYNGRSSGYIQQTVDLSKFAGQKVSLRFEYVTDAAVTGEGLLLDDVSIPAINYSTDFENDNGGWDAAGFVRIENKLPQTFKVTVIEGTSKPVVKMIELDKNNAASIQIENPRNEKVTLIVSGTTPFTREKAGYEFSVTK